EEKQEYIIKPGDTLDAISKKFKTTIELIQKSNNIKGSIIRPNDKLRIFSAELLIEVSKSRNDLVLYVNGRFFKRYQVGTGKYGTTPVGTFQIKDKIVDPPWWNEGHLIPFGTKENVLGTRWLSIVATGDTPQVSGYGIHGTWENDTIGHQSSAGCVRLVNSNVEELFMLVPIVTKVVINE
ncbi:MAG: L,D-transpeptidase family protein, partial [Lentisphaerae bacterium]|nr:L,D-transpeptidase family protein [Lentisphaerota bacterium]